MVRNTIPQELIPPAALDAAARQLREQIHPGTVAVLGSTSPAATVTWDGLKEERKEEWRRRAAPIAGALLAAIDPTFANPHHILAITENGPTVHHPLACRPDLSACPVPAAVFKTWAGDLENLHHGQYPVFFHPGCDCVTLHQGEHQHGEI